MIENEPTFLRYCGNLDLLCILGIKKGLRFEELEIAFEILEEVINKAEGCYLLVTSSEQRIRFLDFFEGSANLLELQYYITWRGDLLIDGYQVKFVQRPKDLAGRVLSTFSTEEF